MILIITKLSHGSKYPLRIGELRRWDWDEFTRQWGELMTGECTVMRIYPGPLYSDSASGSDHSSLFELPLNTRAIIK